MNFKLWSGALEIPITPRQTCVRVYEGQKVLRQTPFQPRAKEAEMQYGIIVSPPFLAALAKKSRYCYQSTKTRGNIRR
jgi:hypothetical protein